MIAEIYEITLRSLWIATLGVMIAGIPAIALAWLLTRFRFPGRTMIESIAMVPMVLPPVAIGLLLLTLLRQEGFIGKLIYTRLGSGILLTPWAACLAAGVVAFPLVMKSTQQAFRQIPPDYRALALTYGKSELTIMLRLTIPLARRGIIYGMILGWARAMGEFGATILVAGMIPGYTETLSLGIYHRLNMGQDEQAWMLALVSVLLCLIAVSMSKRFEKEVHFT